MGWAFPSARQNINLKWSLWGTGALLLLWATVLLAMGQRGSRIFKVEVVLRKQHYLQACAQLVVMLYWGWYWRVVYQSVGLILAQIVFAYAFGALLTGSRGKTYKLGFGPFPIIFSINLFLWFKPDWFYFQFILIAIGILAKDLIHWDKRGQRTHIFNPSSFPLGLVSILLLVTGTTELTWGIEIAKSQFFTPNLFQVIFLAGLAGQYLFGVTTMTMSAVATTYMGNSLVHAATGNYLFGYRGMPAAVFLGMVLLFTDPSTSPRSELGRIIFGIFYGLSVMALYFLLESFDLPSFYDKLLPVPILNLMIQGIDRAAVSSPLKWIDPAALGKSMKTSQRNLTYIFLWTLLFLFMFL